MHQKTCKRQRIVKKRREIRVASLFPLSSSRSFSRLVFLNATPGKLEARPENATASTLSRMIMTTFVLYLSLSLSLFYDANKSATIKNQVWELAHPHHFGGVCGARALAQIWNNNEKSETTPLQKRLKLISAAKLQFKHRNKFSGVIHRERVYRGHRERKESGTLCPRNFVVWAYRDS